MTYSLAAAGRKELSLNVTLKTQRWFPVFVTMTILFPRYWLCDNKKTMWFLLIQSLYFYPGQECERNIRTCVSFPLDSGILSGIFHKKMIIFTFTNLHMAVAQLVCCWCAVLTAAGWCVPLIYWSQPWGNTVHAYRWWGIWVEGGRCRIILSLVMGSILTLL